MSGDVSQGSNVTYCYAYGMGRPTREQAQVTSVVSVWPARWRNSYENLKTQQKKLLFHKYQDILKPQRTFQVVIESILHYNNHVFRNSEIQNQNRIHFKVKERTKKTVTQNRDFFL